MHKLLQLWCQLTCLVAGWFEWQDAKYWAKDIRPAWLQMATKCKNKETKQYYRDKILAAYRGEE